MDLPHTRMLFSYLFLGQYGFSLAAVGTRAAAGYRTALALVPTLARENPYWPRKRYENPPFSHASRHGSTSWGENHYQQLRCDFLTVGKVTIGPEHISAYECT